MRIRLNVIRHELPPTKALWNVSPDIITISKLLEQINDVIPLESDGWGLEDYKMELNGYECLHYLNPHSILKEEDEVKICPLEVTEIRARTLSGRHQISAAGAHLIDGIAFGKAYLKRPSRPPVRIPPSKRPRLLQDDINGTRDHIFANGLGQQLSIDSVPFGYGFGREVLESSPSASSLRNNSRSGSEGRRKSVTFDEDSITQQQNGLFLEQLEGDEDEDEEDYVPSEGDDEDEIDSESGSENGEEFDPGIGPSNFVLRNGRHMPNTGYETHLNNLRPPSDSNSSEPDSSSGLSNDARSDVSSETSSESSSDSSSDTDSDSSSLSDDSLSGNEDDDESGSDSDSDSDSESDSSEGSSPVDTPTPAEKSIDKGRPDITSSKLKANKKAVPPGEGMKKTHARNERRLMSKRLQYLKKTGQVDETMTMAEFRRGLLVTPENFEQRRLELLESIASGGVDVSPKRTTNDESRIIGPQAMPESRSEEILAGEPISSNTNGIDTATTAANNSKSSPAPQAESHGKTAELSDKPNGLMGQAVEHTETTGERTPERLKAKRARLDINSSNRLIFGSLGVKTPRSKTEQEATRAKLTGASVKRNGVVKETPTGSQNPSNEQVEAESMTNQTDKVHSDAWRAKLNLNAVECVDKHITNLSEPPFPFVQRWDSQQKLKRNNGKKRKRNSQYYENDQYDEEQNYEYDQSNEDAGLNYDDETTNEDVLKVYDNEDLPELPEDPSNLPALTRENVRPGIIIAFKLLEVTAATNWSPTISAFKTALVQAFDKDGMLQLRFAYRDRPEKDWHYDEDGNRVYGKFEVSVEENETENSNGNLEISFSELLEPKVLNNDTDTTVAK